MDMTSVEGANLDMAWCDELAKVALVETLEYRVAERNGWMIISFMPKEGYTPLVKVFQDNARVVWESDAFLLPKDGGEPDVSRALGGMTEDEMAELHVAITERRKPKCRTCRPEDCEKWLEGKRGQPEVPEGRRFEKAPRVLQPPLTQDRYRRRLSIFFYSSDNPFANPLRIAQTVAGRTREHVLERWYGLASRSATARFTAFDLKVHVVPADRIPRTGTNRHWQDPASARNFANVWTRETPEALYVYREWPGNYDVPGEGVLGAWAIPDDEKADGKRGPAQKSLGWGLVDYKKEIARVERWAAYRPAPPEGMSDRDTVPEWEPGGQDCERIEGRYLDRRFGNTPHAGPEGPVTLFDEYAEVGLDFLETRGGAEENGLALIADALAWDKTREINYFNRPRLYVSDACENVITALMMWTGEDGKRGACKDWIDLLRYVFEEGVDCLAAGAGVSGQSRGSY